jgi:hypothetical protein
MEHVGKCIIIGDKALQHLPFELIKSVKQTKPMGFHLPRICSWVNI